MCVCNIGHIPVRWRLVDFAFVTHAAHVRYVPVCDGLIERVGVLNHGLHAFYVGHVPRAPFGWLKERARWEHSFHVRNTGNVSSAYIVVKLVHVQTAHVGNFRGVPPFDDTEYNNRDLMCFSTSIHVPHGNKNSVVR